jgi:hypothetical protein
MKFYFTCEFSAGLPDLARRGGPFQRAAEKVDALIGRIRREDPEPLKPLSTTNHGESRIKHCVKYDLTSACRLITVQDQERCFLLYVGVHEDAEKWLKTNKGKEFGLNDKSQIVEVDQPSASYDGSESLVRHRRFSKGFLFERLNDELYDRLICNLPNRTRRILESLTSIDEDKLCAAAETIQDHELKAVILDVFILLINSDVAGAERRAHFYLGDLTDWSKIDPATVVVDSEFLKELGSGTAEYPSFLRRFAECSNYKDWMLFMHPDQEDIAFKDFNGPAKLLGVSGSGKTCIVVQRAIHLAKKYPEKRILVVTLNHPLAQLIDELVSQLADPNHRQYIVVKPFFSVCQELLHYFEPENKRLYENVTWKSGEHIDEIWREYYRGELNNNDAHVMQPVHDSLISRSINAEYYLREEFDWIRSAFPQSRRKEYLSVDRQGRTIQLQAQQRELLLKGLDGWENKMKHVGVTDYLNISTALYRHLDLLEPHYRCILIDESQDFGNIEFSIARKLVTEGENDLFFCGDAAQKVSTKYQNMKEAGIQLHGSRSKKITRNYRNSKEILEVASSILVENMTEDMLLSEDFEILDPEYASFFGSSPVLMKGMDLENEIASAFGYLKQELKSGQKSCISIAGFSMHEVEVFAEKIGVPALNGCAGLSNSPIVLSDLEQTKGFEFDFMCILNCSDGVIPNPQVPVEEHFRELSRLYVAMTRAKLELVMSFSGIPSRLFKKSSDFLIEDEWSSYLEAPVARIGRPKKLAGTVHQEDMPQRPIEMTGEQFLYREEAIGLSPELVQFLREKVDGKGLVSGSLNSRTMRRTKWRTVGDLLEDLTNLTISEHKVSAKLTDELVKHFRGRLLP